MPQSKTPGSVFSECNRVDFKMKIESEALRSHYEPMETEELIERFQSGSLTEISSSELKKLLRERGISDEQIARLNNESTEESRLEVITELASLKDRLAARLIDFLIYGAIIFLGVALDAIFGLDSVGLILIFIIYLSYALLSDALPNGQSVGKRALNISVVDEKTRAPCTVSRSIVRNIFFLTLVFMDWLFVFGKERQRLGDKFACTIVVRGAEKRAVV